MRSRLKRVERPYEQQVELASRRADKHCTITSTEPREHFGKAR
jgi:hypothetical protein